MSSMSSIETLTNDNMNADSETDDTKTNIFKKFLTMLQPNSTDGPLIEPPRFEGSSVSDWIAFFWRNLFPFIIWILAMIWVCYITLYNSRLFGIIVSRIVNRFFVRNGYFKVGSFSLATISGKIMFRDFVYVTEDYSIRIQDGWLVFRWWLPYIPRNAQTEDFSNLDVRLLVLLNGLEVHVYNRTKSYRYLEKLFGLAPHLSKLYKHSDNEHEFSDDCNNSIGINDNNVCDREKQSIWRDLIPVAKMEISVGRFLFGNYLIPSTMAIIVEEAHFTYTSQPAVSPHDLFTHISKCKAENVKIILAPSPMFKGVSDEPPRFMGEGFVVFKTNKIDVYYYQDEPGLASDKPEKIELANGEIIEKFTYPAWGLVIKCGKGTDFRYGPWVDRQREHLYNFFYPPDYQEMKVTKKPKAGERRLFESFDIRLSTLAESTIDVLFSKNEETNALHVNAGPGSYLEITIPWINRENGYVTHILGQILHLDATTSLQFRPLAISETLEFDVKIAFPRVWNDHQEWKVSLTGCKATVNLIYAHKVFFQALIEDWSGKYRPDIVKFVPYTVKFSLVLKDFELITLANEHNWIDCTTSFNNENTQLAICGELFDMTFDLPFTEFLPPNLLIKIWIQGESLDAAIYLPESNPHRDIIQMLHYYSKITSRDGSGKGVKPNLSNTERKWRTVTKSNNWVECWSAPIVALSISYKYWPMPAKPVIHKELEELIPGLEEKMNALFNECICDSKPEDFDPTCLQPDVISVELEIGPSIMLLFGTLFRILWNIKENYLGECQQFYDMSSNSAAFYDKLVSSNSIKNEDHVEIDIKPFDKRLYRPFEVTVSVTLHDIQGHLVKHCNQNDPHCPCIYLERLSFELHKTYSETKLQLLLSPVVLYSIDVQQRSNLNAHLNNGYLTLSSLQLRGHAMFSGVDRPLESETLEYAWLVDVQLGDIAGRLTLPQVEHVVTALETFLLQITQTDCSMQPPVPYQKCVHHLIQSVCPQSTANKLCPYPEDLKYRMIRMSIDSLDVCLVESNVAICVQLVPIKLSTCNIHSCHSSSGITVLIDKISIRQFLMTNEFKSNATNRVSCAKTQMNWLETSSVLLGPMFIDASIHLLLPDNYNVPQNTFLATHDRKTKRLWFLWSQECNILPHYLNGKCGCVGGCAFFGSNKDGVDFFILNVDQNALNISAADIPSYYTDLKLSDPLFGESLLHRGEFVLGIKNRDDECEDEEMQNLITSFNEQLSPSPEDSFDISNIFNFKPLKDSTSENLYKSKFGLIGRQLSIPVTNKTLSAPLIRNDLSPTFALNDSPKTSLSRVPTFSHRSPTISEEKHHKRNRSLSESGKEANDIVKSSALISEILKSQRNTEKRVEFEANNQLKNDSNVLRTKSLESGSSASERYFSAEDVSNPTKSSSSSETVKSPKSPQTLSDSYYSAEQPKSITSATISQYYSLPSDNSVPISCNVPADHKHDSISLSSNNSFTSALSSQEDLALVDLRNQMEKPISESPLLMSSYASHLSHYVCYNWDIPPPIPHFTPSHVSTKDWFIKKSYWKPRFKTITHGFSSLRVVNRDENNEQKTMKFNEKYDNFVPGCVHFENETNFINEESDKNVRKTSERKSENTISKNLEIKSEKITILIKLNDEIDIKFSPLSLEGLKLFIDSVTPTLASIHPISVLNHMNLSCINEVQRSNELKKEKMLYLGQLNVKAWQTLRRQNAKQLNQNRGKIENIDTSLVVNQFEETKTTKLLTFVYINKININIIQASIVEELISFAALDNIRDLTCVSVLSLSLRNFTLFSSHNLRQTRTLHTFMDQSSVSALSFTEKALLSRFFGKKPKKEMSEIETLTIETVDSNLEETVSNATISSIHMQLSRLKNSSAILKDAILTVIPCQHSKVNFRFDSLIPPNFSRQQSLRTKISRKTLQRQECVINENNGGSDDVFIKVEPSQDEHLLGFIMFECGFENINIKGVKRKRIEESIDDDVTEVQKPQHSNHNNNIENEAKLADESNNFSSFIGKMATVWFNFAAPPKTPNTRKIDFTRLDWHLLSTAAPSISAWLSVTDRLILSLKCLRKLGEQRITSVIVCLLTSGLEKQIVHFPPQGKHLSRLLTPLAKSLQDDPSCQLVAALRRYIKTMESLDEFEANFKSQTLPPLFDLQRGIVVLCRQWKNALYMPLFIQQNLLLKKGGKHPLRVLLEEKSKQLSVETESGDETTDNDETSKLLPNEDVALNINKNIKNISNDIMDENAIQTSDKAVVDNADGSESNQSVEAKRKMSTLAAYFPLSARPSIAIPPLLSAPLETIGTGVNKAYEYLFSPNSQNSGTRLVKRDESQISVKSSLSNSNPNVLLIDERLKHNTENYGEENLYWWMACQQDYMKNVTNLTNSLQKNSAAPIIDQESKINTLTSGVSVDKDNKTTGVSFLPTAAQMGDVRHIFHSFLMSLNISPEEEKSNANLEFGQFGTKISICGSIKLFKIDIVESENSPRSRSPSRLLSPNKIPVVNFQSTSPFKTGLNADGDRNPSAFVCDRLSVEFDLRKVKDFEKIEGSGQSDTNFVNEGKVCSIVIIGPEGLNQITTNTNFSIDINCIIQRVNLPLLRLLHQFTAMYENVKENRLEMKSNRAQSFKEELHLAKLRIRASETDTSSRTPSTSSFKARKVKQTDENVAITIHDSDSDDTLVEEPISIKPPAPQPLCWKTMYYLLDLYETKPGTKTFIDKISLNQTAPAFAETKITFDEGEYRGSGRYEPLKEHSIEMEELLSTASIEQTLKPNTNVQNVTHRKSTGNIVSSDQLKNFTNALMQREWTPIVIFGICKIRRLGLEAMLSGLKLEGDFSSFHVSVTHKQKCRGSLPKRWNESSLNGQLGQITISLLEELQLSQQLVVKMTVAKSQTLISCQNKRGKDANSALLTIGPVVIDIPQHPVALHGMMTRSSKQLSTTLQELRITSRQPSRLSRQQNESDTMSSMAGQQYQSQYQKSHAEQLSASSGITGYPEHDAKHHLIKPIVVQFTVILDSFTIGASLLPSLRAQYQMGQVTSSGITGNKAKFVIDVHQHTLSFNTKVSPSEANIPSSANVDLPHIHVSAEYMEDAKKGVSGTSRSESFAEGIVLRKGSYLSAIADIGSFEHSLTTDLLNHLLLVQKVFMKEVNEVVQKMSGNDTKIISEEFMLFTDKSVGDVRHSRYVLFSLQLRLKGIQITATTPTSSAVRLETGQMELHLSNRVQNLSANQKVNLKLFVKLQVDLSCALGQLIKNAIFEEAEPEFQQLAFFKTRINMRNALQDEMITSASDDKEAVLITLHRPLVYIQPLALDKAVLVWLNYKNAYEYWNEQRSNLNSEVVIATQQVLGKVQPITQFGKVFLQLTVNDLGMCLPITCPTILALNQSKLYDSELKAALVVTLENTQITACSFGSLVSKGQFTGLCIRFADDFETSLDDWKPDSTDPLIRNLCVVSEGTYEICSRTITSHQNPSDAKWLLNVSWKMEGFDIHVDTSIGKHISSLFKTMTALAGDEDEADTDTAEYGSVSAEQTTKQKDSFSFDSNESDVKFRKGSLIREFSIDNKKTSRIIEKELNEQAKTINDLRQLGASDSTIAQEVQRLHELEAAVFNHFRRDVIKKLRRPSVRQSSFKDNLNGNKFSSSLYSYEENDLKERTDSIDQTPYSPTVSLDMPEDISPHNWSSAPIAIPQKSPNTFDFASKSVSSNSESLVSESQSSSCCDPSVEQSSSGSTNNKTKTLPEGKKQSSLTSEEYESNSSFEERSSGQTGKHGYQVEPNIDFEFDIKIFFNSGKCVLHTKESFEGKKLQKERSFSGGPFDNLLSPNRINKSRSSGRLVKSSSHSTLKPTLSSSRLKHQTHTTGLIADFTVFLIPGLDIKLHYNSKTINEEMSVWKSEQRNDNEINGVFSSQQSGQVSKKAGLKRASLYAWMTLHSIPDETLISPHILDFVEQALEPIPITPPKTPTSAANIVGESEALMSSVPAQYASYASFPVDIIVYFHVQPTVVRFCCLPVSRVECLLHLPSIDLVFSSKRSENELQTKQIKFDHKSSDKHANSANESLPHSVPFGGLSITGCLADFSLYIFHPYGGQKKSDPINANSSENDSNTSHSGRKDSLSLQVEFVKVNISRSRKALFTERLTTEGRSELVTQSIRFSGTCDVGSASFKYDMRRLNEILAFPKAWYRKTIWKRIFIGEQTISTIFSDHEDSKFNAEDSFDSSSDELTDKITNKYKAQENIKESLQLNLHEISLRKKLTQTAVKASVGTTRPAIAAVVNNPWETLVLFAVNLSKLNITMNMGNVMGNANWLTRGLRSNGRISIDSSGHKSYTIGLELDGSTLDAKGGIVGGSVELSQISTNLNVKEYYGSEPKHIFVSSLHTFENRLDYMGTSVLMFRVSDMDVTLSDEWRVDLTKNFNDNYHPTKRPALIFIHGVLNWDQMQILISKSTTPDIIKIMAKLEEFFTQQFHSSKRVFSSLEPKSFNRQSLKARNRKSQSQHNTGSQQVDNVSLSTDARHHRHWQKVLRLVSGVHLSTLPNPLPLQGTILGGTVELCAQNISLACFYGINFRSKSWGTFSLKQPCISFATEAQSIVTETGSIDTHVIQNLSFLLGRNASKQNVRKNMATVCRISRNVMFPPQFRQMHEWFHYAFSASEIDDVDRFPCVTELDIFGTPMPPSDFIPQMRDSKRSSASPKTSGEFHHSSEIIFAFPSMQLELKTEHLQSPRTPTASDSKPMVDCSFVSDFDGHIFVAVDAEAYFFLHELITSYIMEKETSINKAYSPSADKNGKIAESIDALQRDWREYVCQTWHLEPTVRLLSWAGKNIEPYGVDYILQRLGFSQARTTIPKWIQRGAMDPLDKILSLVMFHMLTANKIENIA